jgi:hypothetical protein
MLKSNKFKGRIAFTLWLPCILLTCVVLNLHFADSISHALSAALPAFDGLLPAGGMSSARALLMVRDIVKADALPHRNLGSFTTTQMDAEAHELILEGALFSDLLFYE